MENLILGGYLVSDRSAAHSEEDGQYGVGYQVVGVVERRSQPYNTNASVKRNVNIVMIT